MKERCVTLGNTTGNKLGSFLLRKFPGRVPLVAGIAPSSHNSGTVDELLGFVGVWKGGWLCRGHGLYYTGATACPGRPGV